MDQNTAPEPQKALREQQYEGTVPGALTLGGGLLCLLLRLYLNAHCFDAQGLLHRGCLLHGALVALSVGVLAGLFFLCRGMGSDCRFRRNYRPSTAAGILLFLAVPCFLAYGILNLGGESDVFTRLTAMLSLFMVPVLISLGLSRLEGKPCAFLFPLGGCLFLIVRLICRFRHWSTDPVIEDYASALLANVMAMLAAFHTAGFSLGQGARRRSLFFCLAAIFFSLLSLADGMEALPFSLGVILWMLGVLPRMKKPQARRRPGGQILPETPEETE